MFFIEKLKEYTKMELELINMLGIVVLFSIHEQNKLYCHTLTINNDARRQNNSIYKHQNLRFRNTFHTILTRLAYLKVPNIVESNKRIPK